MEEGVNNDDPKRKCLGELGISRPIKGCKARLTGKTGLLRKHLMGKRVEQSARTVIGPDPTLKLGQLALPPEMASNLTIPDRVTVFNKKHLENLINEGKANFVIRADSGTRINLQYALYRKGTELLYGDIVVRGEHEIEVKNGNVELKPGDMLKRDGEFVEVKYPERRRFNVKVGDIVERHLRDGDIVLLNRQPTLHKGSMLAKEVVVRPGKTIRMNLATTSSFNADGFSFC